MTTANAAREKLRAAKKEKDMLERARISEAVEKEIAEGKNHCDLDFLATEQAMDWLYNLGYQTEKVFYAGKYFTRVSW
jgi:hypothetical protein